VRQKILDDIKKNQEIEKLRQQGKIHDNFNTEALSL